MSVVVPTLGRETVVRTVETLLAARGGDKLEIVVAGRIADVAVKGTLDRLMGEHPNVKHLEVQWETGDSSRKKNAGAEATSGGILAFLDDDVEVAADWPEKMRAAFKEEGVGLASGPGLVPDGLNMVGRMAGLALSSGAAGYVARRYAGGGDGGAVAAGWDDVIGCNAAYRREAFVQMGGFAPEFYPGEEMLAAWRTEQAGWGIRFVPGARVWHWPRQSLGRFWRQMRSYGATRVRLMRAGVEWHGATLVPGLWVGATVVLAVAGWWWRWAWAALGAELAAYALLAGWFAAGVVRQTKRQGDWRVWGMMWVMHAAYGWGEWTEFFRGGKDLSDKPAGSGAGGEAGRRNGSGQNP